MVIDDPSTMTPELVMNHEEKMMAPYTAERRPADGRFVTSGEQQAPQTRRDFCTTTISGAALLLASGFLPPAFAQGDARDGGATLNLDNDSDLLRAHIKMRYSTGPEFCMGWMRGKRLAFSEGRVEPLCSMLAATFAKRHQVSDNEFEFVLIEVAFYTDYETGELLKTIKMPFSGREVEVPLYRFGPETSRFAIKLEESRHFVPKPGATEGEFATPGVFTMTKSITKNHLHNGDLFLQHQEYGRSYPDNSDRPSLFYSESTIWSAPVKDIIDPARTSVASEMSYSAMTSWRPWMKMGDIPGHTSSNGFGRRAFKFADLPADFRSLLKQEHPDVFENAEALLTQYQG